MPGRFSPFRSASLPFLPCTCVAGIRRGKEHIAGGLAPWLVYLIPLWGLVQILAHTTASSVETRAGCLALGRSCRGVLSEPDCARTRTARRNILSAFLIFATAMAVLCLTQLFTSEGRVLWIFPTGYPDVYATFPSYNNYAQFVELALPIALWRALREGWRSWWYALAGGILYASVIGSASRAGTALCTAELLAMLVIGLVRVAGSGDRPADPLNHGNAADGSRPGGGIHSCGWMGARLAALSAE